MSISPDLMYALFAMDAYNRGYDAQLTNFDNGQLGDAQFLGDRGGEQQQANGFYGEVFLWNNQKVIAIRGTDNKSVDIPYGYTISLGYPSGSPAVALADYSATPQAIEAIQYYRDVVGSQDLMSNNVFVTGHSMGGGIAGLVDAIYGKTGPVFDAMPFELAAENAPLQGLGFTFTDEMGNEIVVPADAAWEELVYGGQSRWASDDTGLTNIYFPNTWADWSTFLGVARTLAPGERVLADELDLPADVDLEYTTRNLMGQRHDASLIVIRMFADEPGVGSDWEVAARYWMPALFDVAIAKAAGATTYKTKDNDESGVMRNAIAYTVLDSGGMPFGNVAVRALFDDTGDLGRVLANSDLNNQFKEIAPISYASSALADIAVQYAADLAFSKSTDSDRKNGILELSEDGKVVKADLDPQKWQSTFNTGATTSGTREIVGVDLLEKSLSRQIIISELASPVADAINAALEFSLAVSQRVTLIEAAATNADVALDGSGASTAYDGHDGGSILIGGDGRDGITGSSGDDFMVGGGGNDDFFHSGGNDIQFGGAGDDTYDAGSGAQAGAYNAENSVIFFGGAGIDTADYSGLNSGIRIERHAAIGNVTIEDGHAGRAAITVTLQSGEVDTLFDVESVLATSYADTIVVNSLEELKQSAGAATLDLSGQSGDPSDNGDGVDLGGLTTGFVVDYSSADAQFIAASTGSGPIVIGHGDAGAVSPSHPLGVAAGTNAAVARQIVDALTGAVDISGYHAADRLNLRNAESITTGAGNDTVLLANAVYDDNGALDLAFQGAVVQTGAGDDIILLTHGGEQYLYDRIEAGAGDDIIGLRGMLKRLAAKEWAGKAVKMRAREMDGLAEMSTKRYNSRGGSSNVKAPCYSES